MDKGKQSRSFQDSVDFLVLGSGISGLYLAYLLSDFGSVLLVTKGDAFESNTYYAQGGVASVLNDADTFQSHISDTLSAGAGLCDLNAVEILVNEGPMHIQRLLDLGARFMRDSAGDLDLRREGGHSQKRIVHATDFTGKEIEEVLLKAVYKKGIPILEHHSAVELITPGDLVTCSISFRQEKRCYGAYLYNRKTWEVFPVQAGATILATGGAGQVYQHTTNSSVATGDGVALASRAGAQIMNMEFYQFHPTTFYQEGTNHGKVFLLTEALRGQGAVIRNNKKYAFLKDHDERAELAPRDIVARAIDIELKRSGLKHVWLDATNIPKKNLQRDFPNVYTHLKKEGINLALDLVPTVPAAHYMCGGVKADLWGCTNVTSLYAVGEVACTGVHGGNRLASNSLLEGLVFADRIAKHLNRKRIKCQNMKIRGWLKEGLVNTDEWILVQHNFEEIQKIMWNYVGITRSQKRLERAYSRIQLLRQEIEDYYRRTFIQNKILELRNLSLISHLITASALSRKQSRGLHYNADYPLSTHSL